MKDLKFCLVRSADLHKLNDDNTFEVALDTLSLTELLAHINSDIGSKYAKEDLTVIGFHEGQMIKIDTKDFERVQV